MRSWRQNQNSVGNKNQGPALVDYWEISLTFCHVRLVNMYALSRIEIGKEETGEHRVQKKKLDFII